MSKLSHILIVCLIATTTALAVNATESSPFQAGIEAYEQGDYTTAKNKFLAALETSETAAAHHNLGLTEIQLDNPAEAAWQLERALLLDPFNRNYHEKLNLVRKQLGLAANARQWHLLFSQIVSLKIWVIIATASFWLLFATIILPVCSGKKIVGSIKFLRIFSLLTLLLSLPAIWLNLKTLKSGIILAEEATALHIVPATAAPESGFARPGERVHVLDQHNDFYQIKTEGQATGWISKDDFRLLID